MKNQKLRILTANAIIMALYLALTIIVYPIASGPIQFRVSESLNQIVVFNRRLMWGIVGGVVVYNAIFGMGLPDVIFGGGQTLLALSLSAFVYPRIKNVKVRLALNTLFFTFSMALIALMLYLTAGLPFWATYGWTALSELIIMSLAAPVMYFIDKKIDFAKQV